MRTLIYKRTHTGDPDPATGAFGNNDCLGRVRGWSFKAIIGVGGKGHQAECNGIAGKLTWVGIGPHRHKMGDLRGPLVTFDHFKYYGKTGPLLEALAPKLAGRMYEKNVRVIRDSLSPEERLEVQKILDTARDAPPSGRVPQPNSQKTSGKCRSDS